MPSKLIHKLAFGLSALLIAFACARDPESEGKAASSIKTQKTDHSSVPPSYAKLLKLYIAFQPKSRDHTLITEEDRIRLTQAGWKMYGAGFQPNQALGCIFSPLPSVGRKYTAAEMLRLKIVATPKTKRLIRRGLIGKDRVVYTSQFYSNGIRDGSSWNKDLGYVITDESYAKKRGYSLLMNYLKDITFETFDEEPKDELASILEDRMLLRRKNFHKMSGKAYVLGSIVAKGAKGCE